MCGICGRYNFGSTEPVPRAELKVMNDRLVHRGPDDEGYFSQENVGLAMRRLSIIDLSTGHQPISNEDGSAWIVFNGEIYNFEDLRADLLARGHKFRTRSDTETIIHLYEEKGTDFPKYLRGMFAVAIWDARRKRLVLARALAVTPEILVLVEPTSAVDAHTEARIAARLRRHRAGRTTVVTSSSPLMLDAADRVAFLRDGRIVATGTHAELLETNADYRLVVTRESADLAEVSR